MRLAMITIVVPDYEEAIEYFTSVLGLDLIEDNKLSEAKRWVVLGGNNGCRILLAKATDDDQRRAVGNQTGGRVGFFLETDDFAAEFERMTKAGVNFEEPPRYEDYGSVAVFRDRFGNLWDLVQWHRLG